MKSSFCIDLQRFMLIPTKFPLIHKKGLYGWYAGLYKLKPVVNVWAQKNRQAVLDGQSLIFSVRAPNYLFTFTVGVSTA